MEFFARHVYRFALVCLSLPCAAYGETMEVALAAAYEGNPALQAERESLKAVDEGVSQATSGFFPTATANLSAGRERLRYPGTGWLYGNLNNRGVTVTQPIFNAGQSWAQYKGATYEVRAARARLKTLEQQVLLDAADSYIAVMEKQEILTICRYNADVLQRQLEASRIQFEHSEATRTDVAQADARLASAQSLLRQAEGDLANARAAYARVIGDPPAHALAMPKPPAALPATLLEAEALAERHPSVEAADFATKAGDRVVDQRIGQILPSVSVQAAATDTRTASRVFGIGRVTDQIMTVNVAIPLYQSGAEYSRIREAKDQRARAHYAAIEARRVAAQNARTAWEDALTAAAVLAANRKSAQAAQFALEGVNQERRLGTRTALDVLDAQQEWFAARIGLARSQRTQYAVVYRLLAAVGRMEPVALGLTSRPYDPRPHLKEVRWQRAGY